MSCLYARDAGEEPKQLLLRRRDILLWTGITPGILDRLSSSGRLPYSVLTENGKRYYRKEDVKRLLSQTSNGQQQYGS
jgi:predicted site-specific integrase-resolvase